MIDFYVLRLSTNAEDTKRSQTRAKAIKALQAQPDAVVLTSQERQGQNSSLARMGLTDAASVAKVAGALGINGAGIAQAQAGFSKVVARQGASCHTSKQLITLVQYASFKVIPELGELAAIFDSMQYDGAACSLVDTILQRLELVNGLHLLLMKNAEETFCVLAACVDEDYHCTAAAGIVGALLITDSLIRMRPMLDVRKTTKAVHGLALKSIAKTSAALRAKLEPKVFDATVPLFAQRKNASSMNLRDLGELTKYSVYAQCLFEQTARLVEEEFGVSLQAPTVAHVIQTIQRLGDNNLSLIETIYHWVYNTDKMGRSRPRARAALRLLAQVAKDPKRAPLLREAVQLYGMRPMRSVYRFASQFERTANYWRNYLENYSVQIPQELSGLCCTPDKITPSAIAAIFTHVRMHSQSHHNALPYLMRAGGGVDHVRDRRTRQTQRTVLSDAFRCLAAHQRQ